MDQMTFSESCSVKDLLQRIWFEEGLVEEGLVEEAAEGWKPIRRRFEIIGASFVSAAQVSVF